jgi:Carboxypeptidase regulatory-like domain
VKRLVRSFGALVLAGAIGTVGSTQLSAAAGQTAAAGSLSGTASSSSGQAMANAVVQLRNLSTGQLTGTTTSNALGQFSFVGLNSGNYAVEVVNAAGQIVGTSASVTVSAGAAVTGVGVTASTAVAAAGVGAGAASGVAAGGAAASTTTAAMIGAAAAAAGVAGAAFTNGTASPSQ